MRELNVHLAAFDMLPSTPSRPLCCLDVMSSRHLSVKHRISSCLCTKMACRLISDICMSLRGINRVTRPRSNTTYVALSLSSTNLFSSGYGFVSVSPSLSELPASDSVMSSQLNTRWRGIRSRWVVHDGTERKPYSALRRMGDAFC